MLILDKQRAVERMLALAEGPPAVHPEGMPEANRGRTHMRVAAYERRASIEATPARRAERGATRGAGLLQPAGRAPSWY